MTGGDYPGRGEYTVGSEIAGYRLEEQIGFGGMALVFRARDVQLGRNVALKLLSPQLGLDESFRQRFIRESRAAAGVDHPNIIPIFAAGQSDDDVLYIAMRYVQGGDVRQLVNRLGPLPPERAIGIITQVASALDAAHLAGLVHRDIKPANMLLDSSAGPDEPDHVYLADFGLSKRSLSTTGFNSMVTGLTSTGQFLGTPAYVAPEQVEGQTVDGRADQYALACTAFEMLTGGPPFERDDDLAIMWAQVSAPPPALSEYRDLPFAADDVLRRALAKNPADRYPACLAFAAALRAALGLHGQSSGRPEPPARPRSEVSPPPAARGDGPHPQTQISWPGAYGAAAAAGAGAAPIPETSDLDQSGAPGWSGGAGRAGGAHPPTAGQPVPPTAGQPVPPPAAGRPAVPPAAGQPRTPSAGSGGRMYPPTEDWQRQPRPSAAESPSRPAERAPAQPFAAQPFGAEPFGAGPSGRGPGGSSGSGPGGGAGRGPGRRTSRWWPRGAIVAGCVVVVGAAIGVVVALQGGGGKDNASGTADNATKGPAAALAPLTAPPCRSTVAKAPTLSNVKSQAVTVGQEPFAVATTADGRYTFVTRKDAITVLVSQGGLAPVVDHTISVPGLHNGAVFTHDGKYLVAALGSGAVVLNVAAAEQGSNAIVGTLTSSFGGGAVEVVVSPDDQFVFVTLQDSAAMAVFNLHKALTNGFGSSDVVGKITLGQQPVGMALSPDDRTLYATSMTTVKTNDAAEGTVSVIDTALAETNPGKAVRTTAAAGCDPVRVIASSDGTVWVTSRESDTLLGFSAAQLASDPGHALMAQVDVGSAPIGETFAGHGSQARILVADSNVRQDEGGSSTIAVIDPAKALRRQPALLGYISTGAVPRQFTIEPGGRTALVTNNGSGQLSAVDLANLP